MAIESSYFELFKKGKDFNQIYFLDNFYENVAINQEEEQELYSLLLTAISNSNNIYVKRSAFVILNQLSLSQVITNTFSVLGLLYNFLFSNESILVAVALKYLPHFVEARTGQIEEKLKELSDDSNAEVASQAYFSLGLIHLTQSISQADIVKCTVLLQKAKSYFLAASYSVENRADAEFYLLLIEWSEALFNNEKKQAEVKFNEIEKNLLMRNLYEFSETALEFDYYIFQIVEQVKTSFNTANNSKHWLEIQPQIQILLDISIEIQKIINAATSNKFLKDRLYSSVFENLEISIYQANLSSEKERLQSLLSQTNDFKLEKFIQQIIAFLPEIDEQYSGNPKLLAMLAENMGSEIGLKLYEQINDKTISPEVISAMSDMLIKNKSNRYPYRAGSIIGQEVLLNLICEIEKVLPQYPKDKLEAFFCIVEEVIRYARTTFVKNDKKRFQFIFSEAHGGKGQKAIEQDLQESMILFFEHSKIADGLEHEQAKFVDGGRVDILYKKDLITIPIELKKSLIRPDQKILEENYIAQAQTYTAGYDQLGIFVLLELSDKSTEPPPNFRDWFRIHHLSPSSNLPIIYPDYIISVVIPGNRTTPHSKSTYK